MDLLRRQCVNRASCEHKTREEQLVFSPGHVAGKMNTVGKIESRNNRAGAELLFLQPLVVFPSSLCGFPSSVNVT